MPKSKASPPDVIARRQDLALRLRRLRNAADLSQHELAAKLGRTQTYVAKIELAKRGVDVAEVEEWAVACGASVEVVVREGDSAVSRDSRLFLDEIESVLRGLSEVELDQVRMFLEVWRDLPESGRLALHYMARTLGAKPPDPHFKDPP